MATFLKSCCPYVLLLESLGGIIFGAVAGFALKFTKLDPGTIDFIGFPGELFMRALKLMILPSLIFNLISGAATLSIRISGKIALRTIGCFLVTSLFSASLGVVLAVIIHPGYHYFNDDFEMQESFNQQNPMLLDGFMDLIRNIVPNNVFTPFFEMTQTTYETPAHPNNHGVKPEKSITSKTGSNILGVITLSLVIGTVLAKIGNEAKVVYALVNIGSKVFSKISNVILRVTPVGVFSMVCFKLLSQDSRHLGSTLDQMALFILVILIGTLVYQLIFLQLAYFLITRKNPFSFYLGVLPASLAGFALQSSTTTLPITMKCMEENVKVDSRISYFVLPLGATLNMDGTALFVSAATVFVAQINGISLWPTHYITICVMTALASLISSTTSGLITMLVVLEGLGLPSDSIAYLLPLDWIFDRLRTMSNVLGDCYTAGIVEHLSRDDLASIDLDDRDEKGNVISFNDEYIPLLASSQINPKSQP